MPVNSYLLIIIRDRRRSYFSVSIHFFNCIFDGAFFSQEAHRDRQKKLSIASDRELRITPEGSQSHSSGLSSPHPRGSNLAPCSVGRGKNLGTKGEMSLRSYFGA